jgi:hypothetical protein
LFADLLRGPVRRGVPILFAAAPLSIAATISIVVAYEIATVGAMVVLVALCLRRADVQGSGSNGGDSAAALSSRLAFWSPSDW